MKNQPSPDPLLPPPPPPQSEASASTASTDALDQLALEADRGGAPQPGAAAPGEPGAPAPAVPTAKFIRGMLAPLFKTLAPNWRVTDEEVEMLAEAYGELADYYGGMNTLGPWAGAIVASVAVLGPRLSIPRKLPPPKPAPSA